MELKTPYYVIHRNKLDSNFKKLEEALRKHWGNYTIGYSYKTNALPWIVRHFDSLGCFAEVVSEDEYNLAKLIGVSKNKIIYNGPIKTRESFVEAVDNGCIVNIDSKREIDWLDEVKVRQIGIRVNFNIEKMCPGQSQCPEDGSRFGFCYENGEFAKAIELLRQKDIRVCGLHLHISSKTRGLDIYRAIAKVACKLQREFEFDLDYLDVGGGFFGGLPTKPQFDEYIYQMEEILVTSFDKSKTKFFISYKAAAATIGADNRNENFAEDSLSIPIALATVIVIPDLETPGKAAAKA